MFKQKQILRQTNFGINGPALTTLKNPLKLHT